MNFACNKLLYRMVTLHLFLIRLLAKKEMMISLFIAFNYRETSMRRNKIKIKFYCILNQLLNYIFIP